VGLSRQRQRRPIAEPKREHGVSDADLVVHMSRYSDGPPRLTVTVTLTMRKRDEWAGGFELKQGRATLALSLGSVPGFGSSMASDV
jgi:hypothetical protein